MKNTIFAATLAMALFCGSALADGNMGNGGYTGCDGTNPPPTCDCNVPNPPAECQGGGFASGQYSNEATFEPDYVLAAEMLIGEAMMAVL